MPSRASGIALVFDRDFGGKLNKLAATQPVWICDSAINRLAAQSLWDKGFDSGEITLFQMIAAHPAEAFSETLEMIDQHHPNWSQLSVVGAGPAEAIKTALQACGPGTLEPIPDGFIFERR